MDKETFCEKLGRKYSGIKQGKRKIDERVSVFLKKKDESIEEFKTINKKIKWLGSDLLGFYNLFSEKAFDDIIDSVEKIKEEGKRTQRLQDYIPIVFLTSGPYGSNFNEFAFKVKELENVDQDFLNLHFMAYIENDSFFESSLEKHLNRWGKENIKNYPYDLTGVMGLAVRNREFLTSFIKKRVSDFFDRFMDNKPEVEDQLVQSAIDNYRKIFKSFFFEEDAIWTSKITDDFGFFKSTEDNRLAKEVLISSMQKLRDDRLISYEWDFLFKTFSDFRKFIKFAKNPEEHLRTKSLKNVSLFCETIFDISKTNPAQFKEFLQEDEDSRLAPVKRQTSILSSFFLDDLESVYRKIKLYYDPKSGEITDFKFMQYLISEEKDLRELLNLDQKDEENIMNMLFFSKLKKMEITKRLKIN